MKSLEDLKKIKEKAQKDLHLRQSGHDFRVVIGMGTCGISAGAREVMETVLDEIVARDIKNVLVTQAGCIGLCKLEPLMEIYTPDGKKVTYIHMDDKKTRKVVIDHLLNGHAVTEYMLNGDN